MEKWISCPDLRMGRLAAVAAHPLAELLECPSDIGRILTGASRSIALEAGEIAFHQSSLSKGLYVVVSGEFVRKTERLQTRVPLGSVRVGELVELAATLGDGKHTYTLSAITAGTLLLLPTEALKQAFVKFPELRMRLLEELAREVSRAYISCCLTRVTPARRNSNTVAKHR